MRGNTQHGAALFIVGLIGGTAGHAAGDTPTLLGAGAYAIPVYPGSGAVEIRPVPLIDVSVWDRLFIRSGYGAGIYVWHKPSSDAGVSIDADLLHRYESDDTRLIGLGNVGKTARANVFITRRCEWLDATLKFSTDVGGEGHGSAVDFEIAKLHSLQVGPGPALGIRAGWGTTWTNEHYMRTFFGLDAQQSARSGLATFSPDGGISSARLFVSARYEVGPHWQVSAQTYVGRLLGDAADSPITQKRSYVGGGIFLAYVVR